MDQTPTVLRPFFFFQWTVSHHPWDRTHCHLGRRSMTSTCRGRAVVGQINDNRPLEASQPTRDPHCWWRDLAPHRPIEILWIRPCRPCSRESCRRSGLWLSGWNEKKASWLGGQERERERGKIWEVMGLSELVTWLVLIHHFFLVLPQLSQIPLWPKFNVYFQSCPKNLYFDPIFP